MADTLLAGEDDVLELYPNGELDPYILNDPIVRPYLELYDSPQEPNTIAVEGQTMFALGDGPCPSPIIGALENRFYLFAGGGGREEYTRGWMLYPGDVVSLKKFREPKVRSRVGDIPDVIRGANVYIRGLPSRTDLYEGDPNTGEPEEIIISPGGSNELIRTPVDILYWALTHQAMQQERGGNDYPEIRANGKVYGVLRPMDYNEFTRLYGDQVHPVNIHVR